MVGFFFSSFQNGGKKQLSHQKKTPPGINTQRRLFMDFESFGSPAVMVI